MMEHISKKKKNQNKKNETQVIKTEKLMKRNMLRLR